MHPQTQAEEEAEPVAAVKEGPEVLGMISLWKDVGEPTLGHVMGDESAAIGIIRRTGLGKVRHLNTSWLWVQEKDASRELQDHRVKGSHVSADFLFTKALDHGSIRRHIEAMGCELMFWREPIASAVNTLSAKVRKEILAMEMESLFKTKRRMDAWTRMDLHSKTYKTRNKGRPTRRVVAYRVTD